MECNKDEAIRAKEIAEKKMQLNDFEGAQKIALKAKNLYPELENIIQMLSICDVHCSAQKKFHGSERDWYGVLQVEKLADEATIKKQYRRLALVLHPDKNRFPGAEAAFKLICEANALLSDPAKKSVYDSRIRALTRSVSSNSSNYNSINRTSQLNKQHGAQGIRSSNGLNREQVPQSTSAVFWTSCPFCKVSYQYHRQFINRSLQCPQCKRVFVAYEVSARGVSSGSKLGCQGAPNMPSKPDVCRTSVNQVKVVTNQGNSEIKMQNAKVSSTSDTGSLGTANKQTAQTFVQKGSGSESVKVASALHDENVVITSNGDATPREPRHTKSRSQKKRKKLVSQCGDSSDADSEDVSEQESFGDAATDLESEISGARFSRRSSRSKQHVSYKEIDEDDYVRPLKRAQTTKEVNRNEQKDAVSSEDLMRGSKSSFPAPPAPKFGNQEMGAARSQESLNDKNEGYEKEGEMRGVTGGKSNIASDAVEIESDSDEDLSSSSDSEARCFDCPDPDFSNFDKLRDESHFRVNQFWACYDTYDSMPRYYAKVIKVSATPFELQFKWLEAVPFSDAYKRWVDDELPVGCGSFKLARKLEKVSGSLSFSHQVHCEMGKKKGIHFIYPRRGEVWAVFRDWDIAWSSDQEDRKDFRYEVIEVLSDYAAGIGIEVCYLNKVTGFVSLFERASPSNSFVIGPTELYKFSHYVPNFKMTGTEREGVPIGSFELDPAALPLNPDDLHFPGKTKMESRNTDPTKHAEGKDKSAVSGGTCTPHKIVDLEGTGAKASIPRRSPRGVNAVRQDTN